MATVTLVGLLYTAACMHGVINEVDRSIDLVIVSQSRPHNNIT